MELFSCFAGSEDTEFGSQLAEVRLEQIISGIDQWTASKEKLTLVQVVLFSGESCALVPDEIQGHLKSVWVLVMVVVMAVAVAVAAVVLPLNLLHQRTSRIINLTVSSSIKSVPT